MLELYHAGLTTCSKKTRLCLKEKGLQYTSHYLDLYRFEHRRPEYLALNTNGVVPTLVHDGKVIIESTVINEYLDEVFPDPPLKPSDPAKRARMRVFTKMVDEYALPAVRVPIWTGFRTAQLKAMDDEEFERVIASTPIVDHRHKLQALRGSGFSSLEFEESKGRMEYVYDRCEQALGDGTFLAGDAISLADINMLPYVDAFGRMRPDLNASHPRVHDWHERMKARPAVREAYSPSTEAPELRFPAPPRT
jgi:glutathione S-transferase